jgi:protease I
MPKVLMLTGDAAESLEVLYPYQRLLEEGYEVDLAGPSKKKLQFVVHDFVDGYDTYTEKPGYTWEADLAFADVDPSDYVALVIPGGRAPEYIRNDPDVKRIIALEPDIEAAGAEFVDAEAVVDGTMISARAWPDHPAWMGEFMRLLKERAPAEPEAAAV